MYKEIVARLAQAAAARNIPVLVGGPYFAQREVVAGLLAVGLIALEVVDGGADFVAGLLVWADGVDGVADHQQRLRQPR